MEREYQCELQDTGGMVSKQTKMIMNNSKASGMAFFLTACLLLFSNRILANEVMLFVKVTIVAPTCVINDNKIISVDFGDVLSAKLNGENYKMPIEYSLKCTGSNSQKFNMSIKGGAASFNNDVLKTDIADFGIAFLENDKPLKINSSISFTTNQKPKLYAVPIKSANATLNGGAFTSSAVLTVTYQ